MNAEGEISLTGDLQDDAIKMISAVNIEKTIIPGHLNGEDVFVLASIIDVDEESTVLFPLAVLVTDQILDSIKMPDQLEEIPPSIPVIGKIDG